MDKKELFKYQCLFFDFDGTLCESHIDIIEAWYQVMKRTGYRAPQFESVFRIGPSLTDMTDMLFPEASFETKQEIIRCFKEVYDDSSFEHTIPYPWIEQLLKELREAGHRLFVLTNKRRKAANYLIDKFHWREFFCGIYCQDSFPGELLKKTVVMERVIKNFTLEREKIIMVGDMPEDIFSGKNNGVATAGVLWGYGRAEELIEAGCNLLFSEQDFLVPHSQETI